MGISKRVLLDTSQTVNMYWMLIRDGQTHSHTGKYMHHSVLERGEKRGQPGNKQVTTRVYHPYPWHLIWSVANLICYIDTRQITNV